MFLCMHGYKMMMMMMMMMIIIIIIWTKFESLAQKVYGLRPKKPKTMNL